DNCKAINPKLEVEYLSRDLNPEAVIKLEQDYQIPELQGVLIVYGPQGDQQSEFIKYDDIFSVERSRPGSDVKPKILFKGEGALMTKLAYLTEGKARPKVYFTQSNGELDLNGFDTNREDVGLSVLKDRLTRANFDVQELKLGLEKSEIPDDAAIVVIARPTRPFEAGALDALRKYMNPPPDSKKKGKLIVLLDVVKDPT